MSAPLEQNHDSMHILANTMKNTLSIIGVAIGLLAGCSDDPPPPPPPDGLPPLPSPVVAPEAARGPVEDTRELRIALVGELRGEIEPCGCPTLPFGGFARREALLARVSEGDVPLLHVDAGETLLKGIASTRSAATSDRADLILALSEAVGVDAWAPGPTDLLALGADGMAAVAAGRKVGPPVVGATWTVDGGALLPATRLWEQGGVRVGIVGVNGPPAGRRDREAVGLLDAVPAVRDAVATLPADLDLVVVLGSMPEATADAIATEVEAVGLVLTTRERSVDPPRTPQRADGTPGALVIETPDRGRYLQVIDLQLGSAAGWPFALAPDDGEWKTRDTLRAQLRNARAAGSPRVASLETQLAELESRFGEVGRGRNLAHVRAIPLGTDLDGVAAVAPAIEDFKQRTRTRAEVQAAAAPGPLESAHAGAGACVNCHTQEFARWGFSGHSKAWQSLIKRKATDNPECVGCHTTAYGEPGGLGELTPGSIRKFRDIQCEACHGPLAGHPDDARVEAEPVTVERCLGCHDAANSPDFDFESYLRQASCQPYEAPVDPAVP
jgi:hypothetical protein